MCVVRVKIRTASSESNPPRRTTESAAHPTSAGIRIAAFVRALAHRPDKPRAWVFAVAANLARDEARAAVRRTRHLTLLKGDPIAQPAMAPAALAYAESRNYTEPLFVFVVMVIAGSKPVLQTVRRLVAGIARLVPVPTPLAAAWLGLAAPGLVGARAGDPAAAGWVGASTRRRSPLASRRAIRTSLGSGRLAGLPR